jgi:hypothetical protein
MYHAQIDANFLVRKEDQEKVTRAVQQGHIDKSDVYPKAEGRGFLGDFYLHRRVSTIFRVVQYIDAMNSF